MATKAKVRDDVVYYVDQGDGTVKGYLGTKPFVGGGGNNLYVKHAAAGMTGKFDIISEEDIAVEQTSGVAAAFGNMPTRCLCQGTPVLLGKEYHEITLDDVTSDRVFFTSVSGRFSADTGDFKAGDLYGTYIKQSCFVSKIDDKTITVQLRQKMYTLSEDGTMSATTNTTYNNAKPSITVTLSETQSLDKFTCGIVSAYSTISMNSSYSETGTTDNAMYYASFAGYKKIQYINGDGEWVDYTASEKTLYYAPLAAFCDGKLLSPTSVSMANYVAHPTKIYSRPEYQYATGISQRYELEDWVYTPDWYTK